ncbi:MAG: arylsulfatase [Actinobacteria bacterium]|nr:arylsulfatase [Actinomycetota bacterium]
MPTDQTNTAQRDIGVLPGIRLPEHPTLPVPPARSGSIPGRTIQDSTYAPNPPRRLLPEDAPNIVVILIDDAGPGLPAPLGGDVNTPTLSRVLGNGVGFNRFHTTAMCSPTRASLLTGRNAHHVGAGQIGELANDWDGYSGHIPRDSALLPEILRNYGYATSAFGKWHNTPVEETGPAGPYDNWPTGLGFEYFYGFLAGEASDWEPNLVRNTTGVALPKTPEEGYHLSEDLADDAAAWLRRHKAYQPDKPFFLYWASGAMHGPQHVHKEWADRYKGVFDDGWDAYRERTFAKAKERGWIPQNAELTERHETMAAWDDIPEEERPFQRRLMEVAAGYGEHADVQAGKVLDQIDALGYGDNTLVFYIWGDNGSSAEGQNGTISEWLAQNGIQSTPAEHIAVLEELGGLDAIGSPLTDNQYHAGWAWAGSAPYKGTKLLASHFGGTRNPMAISWPNRITPDPVPRAQFHRCNDLAPTVLEILGITEPKTVSGVEQKPMDGTSFAYAIDDREAEGRLRTQYFEIMGSRAIYHDGWMASATGPRLPWVQGVAPGIQNWTPDQDAWELYNLEEDWTQARDLAAERPDKLRELQDVFLVEATKNDVLPIGGGIYVPMLHPELRITPPYTSWDFSGDTVRMPEIIAPRLGFHSNTVTIDVIVPESASGVLYKLGSNAGGVTAFVDDGIIRYEYNLFIIRRFKIAAAEPLTAGAHRIEIRTVRHDASLWSPLDITISIDGVAVGTGTVPESAPLFFTANDCLDIGRALGSPVALDYRDRAPFPFTGTIEKVAIAYL